MKGWCEVFLVALLFVAAICFALVAIYTLTDRSRRGGWLACIVACGAGIACLVTGGIIFSEVNDRSNANWQMKELRAMGFHQVRYDEGLDVAMVSLATETGTCQISLYYSNGYEDEDNYETARWILDNPPGDRLKPVTSVKEVAQRPDVIRWCKRQ